MSGLEFLVYKPYPKAALTNPSMQHVEPEFDKEHVSMQPEELADDS